MSNILSRRDWVLSGATGALGVWLGSLVDMSRFRHRSRTPVVASVRAPAGGPDTAVSLRALQQAAVKSMKAGHALSPELSSLGGLTGISGATTDADDVILIGTRASSAPTMDLDTLAVALRSAYAQEGWYPEAPGCSIDPMDKAGDPWAIQRVRVLGMPPTNTFAFAARCVALDYELKSVGAGIKSIVGVHDSFEQARMSVHCAEGKAAPLTVQNRFWFCALYPIDAPRFEVDDSTVMIVHPIGVRVLTEPRLTGNLNAGHADNDPVAEQFAREVTDVIAHAGRREYCELVNDFRLMEIGALLRARNIQPATFEYLLSEHQHRPVDVPQYVVGIRRTDKTELVCGGHVDESNGGLHVSSDVRRSHVTYRGGVDGSVEVKPLHLATVERGRFVRLRTTIIQRRPDKDAVVWAI